MYLHDPLIWAVCLITYRKPKSYQLTVFLVCEPYCTHSSEQPIFHVLKTMSIAYSYTSLSETFTCYPVSTDSLRRNVFRAFITNNTTDYSKGCDVDAYASNYILHNVLEHLKVLHYSLISTFPRQVLELNTMRLSVA